MLITMVRSNTLLFQIGAVLWMCVSFSLIRLCHGDDSYEDVKRLRESLISPSNYSRFLRPVNRQSDALTISASFSVVAVAEFHDVDQKLVTNGLFLLMWTDQRLSWDVAEWGVTGLYMARSEVWTPNMRIINTMAHRDPFADDDGYLFVQSNGAVIWVSAGLHSTYCRLDMKKYPFDIQTCEIQVCPSSDSESSIAFTSEGRMGRTSQFAYPNQGWDLTSVSVDVQSVLVTSAFYYSCPTVSLVLERRSTLVLMNVILPVVLLSILNNMVFLIPGGSGEKISYSITVVLSIGVFMSIVSEITPQASDVVPVLTIYLFILLLSSVFTSAITIATVYLHHQHEIQDEKDKESTGQVLKRWLWLTKNNKRAASPENPVVNGSEKPHAERWLWRSRSKGSTVSPENDTPTVINVSEKPKAVPKQDTSSVDDEEDDDGEHLEINVQLLIKHINCICFIVFNFLWFTVTVWFFIFTNS